MRPEAVGVLYRVKADCQRVALCIDVGLELADPNSGFSVFGGGFAEAHVPTTFDFIYYYNNGDYYYGKVTDNSSYDYHVNFSEADSAGRYVVFQVEGPSTAAVGTVSVNDYFSASTHQLYVPGFTQAGKSDGTSGLGSELDAITVNGHIEVFGVYQGTHFVA